MPSAERIQGFDVTASHAEVPYLAAHRTKALKRRTLELGARVAIVSTAAALGSVAAIADFIHIPGTRTEQAGASGQRCSGYSDDAAAGRVRQVQKALNYLEGAGLKTDNIMGSNPATSATCAALEKAQADFQLTPNIGVLDDTTLNNLGIDPTKDYGGGVSAGSGSNTGGGSGRIFRASDVERTGGAKVVHMQVGKPYELEIKVSRKTNYLPMAAVNSDYYAKDHPDAVNLISTMIPHTTWNQNSYQSACKVSLADDGGTIITWKDNSLLTGGPCYIKLPIGAGSEFADGQVNWAGQVFGAAGEHCSIFRCTTHQKVTSAATGVTKNETDMIKGF
jgi:hypothetical protein